MTSSDPETHKQEMKKLQAAQFKKRRELKDPERGLVLVHTGDGKGKSSSAFGVIARALGWGQKVAVVQFIKGKWKTGEKQFFSRFDDALDWHVMGDGFTWDTQDREQDIEAAEKALDKAKELIGSGNYALVVLDEINIAMRYDYLETEAVIAALEPRRNTSVILTGRNAKPELMEYADTVTEMTEVKHAFHSGIRAQQGIDF
ncbi:MAG: cob(I)yrinic acid a,c-diamide adenosyltransferase [Pseudomonadota bacterium]